MKNIKQILEAFGFTFAPDFLAQQRVDSAAVKKWFSLAQIEEAVQYYGLEKHNLFMKKFLEYKPIFEKNDSIQTLVFVLNHFLFTPGVYNWNPRLERACIDMLPAFIILSGYQKHMENMKRRFFDDEQMQKHKKRIFECCTIGFDTYRLEGIHPPQLKWASHFIKAEIVEIGRLQFELKEDDYGLKNLKLKNKCIGVHIPRGEPLDNLLVEESFKMAKKMIPQYFKEFSTEPQFMLRSWLLTNDLEDFLSSNSRIRQFRERFHVLGYCGSSSISTFLFNTESKDVSTYPAGTSLQMQVKKALLNGRCFYDGIGILKQP